MEGSCWETYDWLKNERLPSKISLGSLGTIIMSVYLMEALRSFIGDAWAQGEKWPL